jgi:CO dehydrogenase/acetyl-CoA synthase beta subunit
VVWITRKTLDEIRDLLAAGRLPATEEDAASLEELSRFLGGR